MTRPNYTFAPAIPVPELTFEAVGLEKDRQPKWLVEMFEHVGSTSAARAVAAVTAAHFGEKDPRWSAPLVDETGLRLDHPFQAFFQFLLKMDRVRLIMELREWRATCCQRLLELGEGPADVADTLLLAHALHALAETPFLTGDLYDGQDILNRIGEEAAAKWGDTLYPEGDERYDAVVRWHFGNGHWLSWHQRHDESLLSFDDCWTDEGAFEEE